MELIMQFNFKSIFLFTLIILTNSALSAKIGKPIKLYHGTCKDNWCNEVTQVIFSGNSIITSSNRIAKLWNRNGNLLRTLAHKEFITHKSFSPNGSLIATAIDNAAFLQNWSGTTLATLQHTDRVNQVIFNNISSIIATASDDNTVKIWQPNGTLLFILQHGEPVKNLTFSHNGTMIATVSKSSNRSDYTVTVWTSNGQLLYTRQTKTNKYYNASKDYCLVFSHDDNMISAATKNTLYNAKIWDKNGELIFSIPGDSKGASQNSIVFSHDNSKITRSSCPGLIELLSLDGKLTNTLNHQYKGRPLYGLKGQWSYHVAFSHDNAMIATTTMINGGGTARIWDKNGNLLHILQHCGRISSDIVTLVFFSDDNRLATVASDNTIKIWNLNK
jgi:WD40 repeat protein